MTLRAALYLRVSTVRQAEKELSIPDQRKQVAAYCEREGFEVVAEFVEPGASATDDKRPEFQRMIDAACHPDHPFDAIVVHSFSRFYRDAVQSGVYQRKLEKNGVRVCSITQDVGNDATGRFIRQIIAAADELSSAETAKHVLRAMKENARQGFWNGARPPYGYSTTDAEKRGDTIKKRLEINEAEAPIVRRIFNLYLTGEGDGPLGIKGIADCLNRKGYRNRQRKAFSKGFIADVLSRSTYIGKHYFNRSDSKTRKTKDKSEWIEVAVPSIIAADLFERVQAELVRRSPARDTAAHRQ